ncbi:MAG: response regulator [Candidatus Nitrosopumilus sp. bin_68KS]
MTITNRNYKVLIVDDSSFMRTLLSKIFSNTSGVGEIYQANNGNEALITYKDKRPDLVTMDIDMPEMDGIEAAKQIKSIDPNAKIVMVSSSDKKNTRDEAEKIGISQYIRKPFDRLEIKKTIESLSKE